MKIRSFNGALPSTNSKRATMCYLTALVLLSGVLLCLFALGSGPALAGSQAETDNRWVAMTAGTAYTLALRSNGTLWSWGWNYHGQLGLGNIRDRSSPTQVGADNRWVAVAAGGRHSLALQSDGTLWSWGWNVDGQLGLGDNTDRWSPTRVGTDNGWVTVTAGGLHSLALRSDGTLWAWGYNSKGGLGLGDETSRSSPTRVGTDNSWISVNAGDYHSLALQSNGALWSWGWNIYGQLGLGDETSRFSPTRVGTDNGWAAVMAGDFHSLALRFDGTLWSWGSNGEGELGLGDKTDRRSPTQISGISPGTSPLLYVGVAVVIVIMIAAALILELFSRSLRRRKERPLGVTILAILSIIAALVCFAFAADLANSVVEIKYIIGGTIELWSWPAAVFYGTVSLLLAYGCWKGKRWSRILLLFLSIIGIILVLFSSVVHYLISGVDVGILELPLSFALKICYSAFSPLSYNTDRIITIVVSLPILYYLTRSHVKAFFGKQKNSSTGITGKSVLGKD